MTVATSSIAGRVTDEQKRQYVEEGYFILERAISEPDLEMLRDECQRFIDDINAELDAAGQTVMGINHRDKRYFISNRHKKSDGLRRFLFSEQMADVCRSTLGSEAYLFVEQYVVKCAEVGMKFAWHQDSGYVGHEHTPYLSVWCALDDMTEANGTIYVLPYSRAGGKDRIEHRMEKGTNDMVGYFGDDPGIPIVVPAGSMVCFSSTTFHRSGSNTTDKPRRSYLCQYSPEVILKKDGSGPWSNDTPFLKNGRNVYREL